MPICAAGACGEPEMAELGEEPLANGFFAEWPLPPTSPEPLTNGFFAEWLTRPFSPEPSTNGLSRDVYLTRKR